MAAVSVLHARSGFAIPGSASTRYRKPSACVLTASGGRISVPLPPIVRAPSARAVSDALGRAAVKPPAIGPVGHQLIQSTPAPRRGTENTLPGESRRPQGRPRERTARHGRRADGNAFSVQARSHDGAGPTCGENGFRFIVNLCLNPSFDQLLHSVWHQRSIHTDTSPL